MIRKAIVFILIACLLAVPAFADDAPPETSAEAVILVHPASGRVLYAKNENSRMLMASTTKLMTALTAVQELSPEMTVQIKPEWTRIEGSSMYLRAGDRYTVRELLIGLLLASGNDAALALAGTAAEDTDSFVAKMNETARELGLENTHFDNPHGLDSPGQYSTAADLAVIMRSVCRQPLLREIMGMRAYNIHALTCENHNKLLGLVDGVFGGKTGYTKAAGRCLVSCCRRDDMELICVTLSDPDDWRDHRELYDWAYGAYLEVVAEGGCRIPLVGGDTDAVSAAPEKDVAVCLERGERYSVRYSLPPFVFAPIGFGEPAGEMTVTIDGGMLIRIPLYCRTEIKPENSAEKVWREIVDRLIGIYAV